MSSDHRGGANGRQPRRAVERREQIGIARGLV
jgi:hypothetical protein